MSEYPDHLNPFKEKKKIGKSLTRSFREIKGFIRQSFRKKKTDGKIQETFDNVEIRKPLYSNSCNTMRNNIMSAPSLPTYNYYTITSPPLPRSRFKERLSRSSLSNMNDYDEKNNPFASLNPFDEPPVPYRRKKSKKRAPLPPSCSNPDVNVNYTLKGSSKWSLTSSETDCTIDDRSEYSGEFYCSQSLRECLDNFNKEMDTLNKESLEIENSFQEIIQDEKEVRKSVEELDREINNNEKDTKSIPEEHGENFEYMDDSSTVENNFENSKEPSKVESNDQELNTHDISIMAKIEEETENNDTKFEKTEENVDISEYESAILSKNSSNSEENTEINEQTHKPNFELDDTKAISEQSDGQGMLMNLENNSKDI